MYRSILIQRYSRIISSVIDLLPRHSLNAKRTKTVSHIKYLGKRGQVDHLVLVFFNWSVDWSRKLAPSSQPISCRANPDRNLVTRIFPRFFFLTLSSNWLLVIFAFFLIGCHDCFGFGFLILSRRNALYEQWNCFHKKGQTKPISLHTCTSFH